MAANQDAIAINGVTLDDFRIPSKSDYCEYCCNLWDRIF